MPHSCLESQGCHLIPFSYLLSSSSTYSSCTVFLSCNFCNNFPFSLLFSKIFSNICVWDRPFCLPIVFDSGFRKSLIYFLKVFINWTFVIRVSAGWKHAVLPTDVYVHKWVYIKLHFSLKRSTFMLEILLDFEDYASSHDLCNSECSHDSTVINRIIEFSHVVFLVLFKICMLSKRIPLSYKVIQILRSPRNWLYIQTDTRSRLTITTD